MSTLRYSNTCELCGRQFLTHNKVVLYCSKACKDVGRRNKLYNFDNSRIRESYGLDVDPWTQGNLPNSVRLNAVWSLNTEEPTDSDYYGRYLSCANELNNVFCNKHKQEENQDG